MGKYSVVAVLRTVDWKREVEGRYYAVVAGHTQAWRDWTFRSSLVVVERRSKIGLVGGRNCSVGACYGCRLLDRRTSMGYCCRIEMNCMIADAQHQNIVGVGRTFHRHVNGLEWADETPGWETSHMAQNLCC